MEHFSVICSLKFYPPCIGGQGKQMHARQRISTVNPRCIVFRGMERKRYIGENNITGKPLKIIDKNNLMIIITSC
jgi:hypothetical protein